MSVLQDALRTYLFLIPLFVLLFSEGVKFLVYRIRTGGWLHRPFQHGGMPSSHSAFVTSLLIIVERKLGAHSVEFAIAAVFSCVVWYDAMAVRGQMNKQAMALNKLQEFYKLAEDVGHSFAEVIAGILLGGVVTAVGVWVS